MATDDDEVATEDVMEIHDGCNLDNSTAGQRASINKTVRKVRSDEEPIEFQAALESGVIDKIKDRKKKKVKKYKQLDSLSFFGQGESSGG